MSKCIFLKTISKFKMCLLDKQFSPKKFTRVKLTNFSF